MGAALMGGATSCDDFEEINFSPSAAGESYIHPDYALNKSFYEAQMDPDIAERVFVYNWASITRIIGDNTMGVTARYSNEYNDRLYSYTSNWVKYATNAINMADVNPGTSEHEQFLTDDDLLGLLEELDQEDAEIEELEFEMEMEASNRRYEEIIQKHRMV